MDRKYIYVQLWSLVVKVVSVLIRLGYKKGDVIFIYSVNILEFFIFFLVVVFVGIIVIMLNLVYIVGIVCILLKMFYLYIFMYL